MRTFLVEDHFYVALRERRLPKACIGGKLSVKETRSDHVIYRIDRDASPVVTIEM